MKSSSRLFYFLFIASFAFLSETALARYAQGKSKSPIYITFFYESISPYEETTGLGSSSSLQYRGEVGIRMFNSFFFTFTGGVDAEQAESFGGIGARLNTPGFLFIGGKETELKSKARHKPINTAVYASFIGRDIELNGERVRYYENALGLAIELFLFSPFYLSLDFSGHSHIGGYSFHSGAGLGYEF